MKNELKVLSNKIDELQQTQLRILQVLESTNTQVVEPIKPKKKQSRIEDSNSFQKEFILNFLVRTT